MSPLASETRPEAGRSAVGPRAAAIFKALGHPTRVILVSTLGSEGDKCVCELVDRVGFDQSTVSKHLSVLKQVGIVTSVKDGLKVIYRLRMKCAYKFLQCIKHLDPDGDGESECGLCSNS